MTKNVKKKFSKYAKKKFSKKHNRRKTVYLKKRIGGGEEMKKEIRNLKQKLHECHNSLQLQQQILVPAPLPAAVETEPEPQPEQEPEQKQDFYSRYRGNEQFLNSLDLINLGEAAINEVKSAKQKFDELNRLFRSKEQTDQAVQNRGLIGMAVRRWESKQKKKLDREIDRLGGNNNSMSRYKMIMTSFHPTELSSGEKFIEFIEKLKDKDIQFLDDDDINQLSSKEPLSKYQFESKFKPEEEKIEWIDTVIAQIEATKTKNQSWYSRMEINRKGIQTGTGETWRHRAPAHAPTHPRA